MCLARCSLSWSESLCCLGAAVVMIMTIGIGMLPRGEVGLIFASNGKVLGVIDGQLFAAIVLVVVITTAISPSLLKWSLRRGITESAVCNTGP